MGQIKSADDGIVSHDDFKRQHQNQPQRQTTDGSMRMIRLRRRQSNQITPNIMPNGLIQGSDVVGEQKLGSGQVWGLLFGVGLGSGINISGRSPLGFLGFIVKI